MKYLMVFENYIDNSINEKVKNLMDELENNYPVDLYISYYKNNNVIILSKIVIIKQDRSQGIGSKIMEKICDFADENNLRIGLTPSSDFGGSKSRLIKFYKNFGFKNYKGYEFRESMVREPLTP